MNFQTAEKIIDLLFDLYEQDNPDSVINKATEYIHFTFIGGEPLMNVKTIDHFCQYFTNKCMEKNSPWAYTWKGSVDTNGAYYFSDDVVKFRKKWQGFINFAVTVDGPEEIHNTCRTYHNGEGNFNDALAALLDTKKYTDITSTKVTIAKENLKEINTILKFFNNIGITEVYANCANEPDWDIQDAKIFYSELIKMADYLLNSEEEYRCSLFMEFIGKPLPEEENQNWCGGTGKMLAFDPFGIAYPCLRYMPSSLGNERKPLVIGDCSNGLYTSEDQIQICQNLQCITRRSQSTDECFYCPIASGCSWCSAWNYQKFGTADKRSTSLCIMHKARVLANSYYWNKFYLKNDIKQEFNIHLPENECLKIIDRQELDKLLELNYQAHQNCLI